MTEQQLSQYAKEVNRTPESEDVWRNEVQDRLARYKHRRGRRIEGAYTMRFPFPAEEVAEAVPLPTEGVPAASPSPAETEAIPELEVYAGEQQATPDIMVADQAESEAVVREVPEGSNDFVLRASSAEAAEDEDTVFVDPTPRPRPKRKVIAFPRQSTLAPEVVQRLADPVTTEAPRILDVPEELEAIPSTPFLDGLQLDLPDAAAIATSREHVDLPFQAAGVSRRLLAGVVDLSITGVAAGVFAAVAYTALDHPEPTKPLILGFVAGAVLVWIAYQYLFVVHAGKTLGMMATQIRFCTFAGRPPVMRQRRNRVLGLFLSSLSLGMGLMWGFVDVDGLCWHDRLSHTFLSRRD
jgi:uncharacterized RDD family membrane protein YckC